MSGLSSHSKRISTSPLPDPDIKRVSASEENSALMLEEVDLISSLAFSSNPLLGSSSILSDCPLLATSISLVGAFRPV